MMMAILGGEESSKNNKATTTKKIYGSMYPINAVLTATKIYFIMARSVLWVFFFCILKPNPTSYRQNSNIKNLNMVQRKTFYL